MEAGQRVFAIVLAYRGAPDVIAGNLAGLGSDVGTVVVVDNSGFTDASRWAPVSAGPRNVLPVMTGRNLGVAAGYNAGIRVAIDRGADLMLLLDEDSQPGAGMVNALVNAWCRLGATWRVAAVGPDFVDATTGGIATFPTYRRMGVDRNRCVEGSAPVPTDTLMSSGMLLHRAALAEIGPMDERLFVDYVDTEWCLRARDLGWKCFGVCGAHMEHAFGDRSMSLPWPWRGVVAERDPGRTYYIYRNALRLFARPRLPVLWKLVELRRLILLLCLHVLRSGSRWQHLRMAALGIRDALMGRTGAMVQETEASRHG